MEHVYAVLSQKEGDLQRVRREVLALRMVAPLLEDERGPSATTDVAEQPSRQAVPEADRPSDRSPKKRTGNRIGIKPRATRLSRQLKEMVTPMLEAAGQLSEKVS